MLSLLLAVMSYTVIPDTSELPLLVNPVETQKIQLQNGLNVLLISDKDAGKSAACITVGVGSWDDPDAYPGMAHFCEHMLFLGTQKYPLENEFSAKVTDAAGLNNAYTAPDHTAYIFSSETEGFVNLLDRFGHFFIDPLFNESGIAREMYAVDQEFAKNLENDGWREYMIFKETGAPHPNQKFSTGNSQTLSKIPQNALKEWHANFYGADKMTLAIYSPLPIATQREAVLQIFSAIPQAKSPSIDHAGQLSSEKQRGHITYIKPIQDKKRLSLSWELPEERDATKSAETLAYALKRGQEKSLYETLKNDLLIDSMTSGVEEIGGPTHKFFSLTLDLTEKGIQEINHVIGRCFEAIALYRDNALPTYLFKEQNQMARLNYQYQERKDPFDMLWSMAQALRAEPLTSFPRGNILASGLNTQKIQRLASSFTPENCSFTLLAPPELSRVTLTNKEKWHGTEYTIKEVPSKLLTAWNQVHSSSEIQIAPPNAFLPENLAALPEGPSIPHAIAENDLGIAYYVRSPEFKGINSVTHLRIHTPVIDDSARAAVLVALYTDHLTDMLHPTLAAASAAGLSFSIDLDKCALHLQVTGYSDKSGHFLAQVLKEMPENPPTAAQFAVYMDRHQKGYANAQKELAVRQAKNLLDSFLTNKPTNKAKLDAIQKVTYQDFLAFYDALFDTTYCKALFAGNLTQKQAESSFLDIIHAFGKAPYPKSEHTKPKVLNLPEGGPYQIAETTAAQGNATFLALDQGAFTYEKRAAQETLAAALKEAFFTELRSRQKTGYIAQSYAQEQEERLFQFFTVQSNSHDSEDLLFRFEQFLETYNDSLKENIPEERFNTLKANLISSLQTRFRNLSDKSALWDDIAFNRNANFAFLDQRIEGLKNLTYKTFLKESTSFLSRQNRKRLAVLLQGRIPTPFIYQTLPTLVK